MLHILGRKNRGAAAYAGPGDGTKGALWLWCKNAVGSVGDGSTTARSSPVQVGSLTDWTAVTMAHSARGCVAIRQNGTLWAWGEGSLGQLGDGSTTDKSSPAQIGSLTTWNKVMVTNYLQHRGAIKQDGTLWMWGDGDVGQLGQGNTTTTSSPVQVGSLTNWKAVSGKNNSTIAVKTDGTLWAWGAGAGGALGLGNTTNYSSPVQVGSLTDWDELCGRGNGMLARKTDGTIWSWGGNTLGVLGDGTTTTRSSPVQIGSLTTWASISVRFYTAHAIKTDGTLWGWGQGNHGGIGLNNTTHYSSPVQVGSLTDWSTVGSSAGRTTAAIKTDGTHWAWGRGDFEASTGLNNLTKYSSPVQVGSLTTWANFNMEYGREQTGITDT